MRTIIITITLLATSIIAFSQCDNYYLGLRCRPTPQEAVDMKLSSQSKSAYIEAYQTYTFHMVFFGKMDYKVIFCSKDKFYPVHFILTNRNTGEVLFDNKDDQYVESIGLSVDETIPIQIQVTLLAEGTEFKDLRKNRACLGICIMYRRIPKLGFLVN
jgi:hypothetical protein